MQKKSLTVGKFYADNCQRFKLQLLNSNAGFERTIQSPELHRPGLALAGFLDVFTYERVQILGNTEISYLFSMAVEQRRDSLERFMSYDIPCIVVMEQNEVPPELLSIATRRQICLFRTNFPRTVFTHHVVDYLNYYFAQKTTKHGTLVDVYGIGLLFTGRSGIGKSEIALDLIERGHRLVADDLVIVTKKGEEILMGEGREIAEHHLELRGLGLVDARSIFGIRSVRVHKRVEVEVHLVEYDSAAEYDRTGLDGAITTILGVEISRVILPVNPGKNITVLAETIALNHLLKLYGHNTPVEFNKRLMEKMRQKERQHLLELKMRDFLDKDFE